MPGRVELVRTKPGCVQVVVETDLAIRGGEFGIGYDSRSGAVEFTRSDAVLHPA